MIAMTEEPYTPEEAVDYLREKRGITTSVGYLRVKRLRGGVQPGKKGKRISLWTKAELDALDFPRSTPKSASSEPPPTEE